VPEFGLAAAGTSVAVVLVGAVLFVFRKPGSLKWNMKHASLGPDEFSKLTADLIATTEGGGIQSVS
jgi:hypothetical protein